MKNMKRAQRRTDSFRMKERARAIYPWDQKARSADHMANCSCYMCGNPRKHFDQKTMAEKRSEIAMQQDLVDIAQDNVGMSA